MTFSLLVPPQSPANVPALELKGIRKAFGTCIANAGVDLRVLPGTIHGVVGENGAGKSTAMKIAYGMIQPDAGKLLIQGEPRRFRSPANAIVSGIGMVHQHFMLAAPHSGLDNILLGAEPNHWGIIDRPGARKRLLNLARQHGLEVDLDVPVQELSVGAQQKIEILKLLYRDASILILDEPTAVLTPQQTAALFGNLRRLRSEGKTIILITHKLREVMEITDEVTVLRRGATVATMRTSEASPQLLADKMVGRNVNLTIDCGNAKPTPGITLELKGISLENAGHLRLNKIDLAVRAGEIVGIAGVEGNGQSDLLQAILHPNEKTCRTAGTVSVLGQDVTRWSSRDIRKLGVAMVPEDRHAEGLLLERPLWENFLLGHQHEAQFTGGPLLSRMNIRSQTAAALQEYDVRPAELDLPVRNLSGGNQQKLIIARELAGEPKLLIVAQPTRGVDVGAIEFIHRQIIKARDRGAGVLLISSELDEIQALSDRILVIYAGSIVADFRRGEASESELGLKMGGS